MHERETAPTFPHHSGGTLSAKRVFFAPPPPEIGPVQSGFSSQMAGQIDLMGWVTAIFGASFFGIGMVGLCIGYLLNRLDVPWIYPMAVGVVLTLIFLWAMLPHPTCTYVGKNGLARITRIRGKDTVEMFLFSRDSSLTVERTRMHHNGIYTGTHSSHIFLNTATQQKFSIGCDFYEMKGKIPENSLFHFGDRGEIALTEYLLPLAIKRLEQGESERFSFSSAMNIELGPRSLIIQQREKRSEIRYEDIERVSVDNGTITLMEKGGKRGFLGLGKEGVFSFSYSLLPNARLFFLLLQHQVVKAHQREQRLVLSLQTAPITTQLSGNL